MYLRACGYTQGGTYVGSRNFACGMGGETSGCNAGAVYSDSSDWLNTSECLTVNYLLSKLKEFSPTTGFGILRSYPAAIMTALRVFNGGLENVDLEMIREHASGIMAASPVRYVREAVLAGSIFGKEVDGSVCCADTKFYVDHEEPMSVLDEVKSKRIWRLGELPEGCEWLVAGL